MPRKKKAEAETLPTFNPDDLGSHFEDLFSYAGTKAVLQGIEKGCVLKIQVLDALAERGAEISQNEMEEYLNIKQAVEDLLLSYE